MTQPRYKYSVHDYFRSILTEFPGQVNYPPAVLGPGMSKFINSGVTSAIGFAPMDDIDGLVKNLNDLRNDVNNMYVIFLKTLDGIGVGKFKVIRRISSYIINIEIIIICNGLFIYST